MGVLWTKTMQASLAKELQNDLTDEYLVTESCVMMTILVANPEVKFFIGESEIKRDQYQVASQNQPGVALNTLGWIVLWNIEKEGNRNNIRDGTKHRVAYSSSQMNGEG